MAAEETSRKSVIDIAGHPINFELKCGPLVYEGSGGPLRETSLLEICYADSERHLRERNPYGHYSFFDFTVEAHRLAESFCEENGLTVVAHLNSYPEFQAIVTKRAVS